MNPLAAATTHPRTPIAGRICASICVALCLLSSRWQAAAADSAAGFDAVPPAHQSTDGGQRPAFRLGDAARPFAWATVIADFNADGRPDVAIADHMVRYGRYAYRIELSVSGQEPYFVTFESPQPSVTLSVFDVDHDDDLDLLVAAPLSGQTIDVWLNDGSGHFTAAKAPHVTAPGFVHLVGASDSDRCGAMCVSSPRRSTGGATLWSLVDHSCFCHARPASDHARRSLPGNGTSIRPRAPPLDFLPTSFPVQKSRRA